jgi:cytochrome P450
LLALELFGYLEGQLESHRESRRDDLLDGLLNAEIDGERLTQQELLGFCMTLLVAGNETTRSLMTGGLIALAQNPDQRARLVDDPALVPAAVEEMLRWVTPIMAMARTTTEGVTIGDTPVGPGEFVLMVYGAANRDAEVFGPDSDRFDIRRSPNPHVAFGFGEHFCIGAGLARLETRVLLSELLARWPNYEVVGDIVRAPSILLRQFSVVPVLFAP